jgi:ABC-type dipeptide/oligopeptide/nickel transport system ATPase subunit
MRLLETRGLRVEYKRANLLSRFVKVALNGVDFHIDEGSSTGLAGASGSGKSTLARCLAGVEKPSSGVVLFRDTDIIRHNRAERLAYGKRVQLVFQDAAGSLNPRFTAADAVSEPIRIAGLGNTAACRLRAARLMEEVGLPSGAADRPALEFSGGQRQRLVIARALAAAPEMVLFDEAFSGIDDSVQSSLLELLVSLRQVHRLTYLFISHDLGLLARICGEIAILHHGRVVERASTADLLSGPAHPYSRELVAAIPPIRFV